MTRLLTFLRRFAARDDGNATIEFCFWFPFFFMITVSAIEVSLLTTRQSLLVSAVDRTVRDLQLGNLGSPDHDELKTIICNHAGFIPDCTNALHIELERISTADFAFREGTVQCVDMDEETEPVMSFTNGTTNDLMLMTVCAAVHPMVPTTGMGMKLATINGGSHYAIVAFSAYVVEPV
ncbi:MAG: pilus assembly protein [Rhodobacteraceae bacterium]|nr:pilus assembly protein [Paracoccaceae bacterium]